MNCKKITACLNCALVLVLLVMFLSACSSKKQDVDEINYEYTQEFVRISDLCGSGWLINENVAVTSDGATKYYFHNNSMLPFTCIFIRQIYLFLLSFQNFF